MGRLKNAKGKADIDARINRLRRGILGDFDSVGDGIIELRVDSGPGYRVYCVDDGNEALILLAGSKRTQKADIKRAKRYWKEYKS